MKLIGYKLALDGPLFGHTHLIAHIIYGWSTSTHLGVALQTSSATRTRTTSTRRPATGSSARAPSPTEAPHGRTTTTAESASAAAAAASTSNWPRSTRASPTPPTGHSGSVIHAVWLIRDNVEIFILSRFTDIQKNGHTTISKKFDIVPDISCPI